MTDKTLAEALCEAQKNMKNPPKDKTAVVQTKGGGRYSYNYCTLDTVIDIVRPALNEQGVFLYQSTKQTKYSTVSGAMICVVETAVCYGSQKQVLDNTPYEYASDPQEFGKRETYARRYSLLKAFGLAGDDDTDGDVGENREARPRINTQPKTNTRRDAMVERCKELIASCTANGVKSAALHDYLVRAFGAHTVEELSEEELVVYGKYLAQIEKDAKELNNGES